MSDSYDIPRGPVQSNVSGKPRPPPPKPRSIPTGQYPATGINPPPNNSYPNSSGYASPPPPSAGYYPTPGPYPPGGFMPNTAGGYPPPGSHYPAPMSQVPQPTPMGPIGGFAMPQVSPGGYYGGYPPPQQTGGPYTPQGGFPVATPWPPPVNSPPSGEFDLHSGGFFAGPPTSNYNPNYPPPPGNRK